MPLPDNWTTVTLTGEYQLVGVPLKGSVTFTPTERVVDAAAGVIQPPGGHRASLDKDGRTSVVLPVVDDPDVSPNGWAWRVLEELVLPTGQRYSHTYDIQVTSAMGSTVKLADLAPVTAVAEVSPYLRGVDLGTVVETPAGAQVKADAAQATAITAAADYATDAIAGRLETEILLTSAPLAVNALYTSAPYSAYGGPPAESLIPARLVVTSDVSYGLVVQSSADGSTGWTTQDTLVPALVGAVWTVDAEVVAAARYIRFVITATAAQSSLTARVVFG